MAGKNVRSVYALQSQVRVCQIGRAYVPLEGLLRLAAYRVSTTRELEDSAVKRAGVFTFPA